VRAAKITASTISAILRDFNPAVVSFKIDSVTHPPLALSLNHAPPCVPFVAAPLSPASRPPRALISLRPGFAPANHRLHVRYKRRQKRAAANLAASLRLQLRRLLGQCSRASPLMARLLSTH
jgi:hypothetical protein